MRARTINSTALWQFYSLQAVAGMQSEAHAEIVPNVSYRTVTIEDVDIFFSEAGDPSNFPHMPQKHFSSKKMPGLQIANRRDVIRNRIEKEKEKLL